MLLVGLGNPGERYARTRHNVGFHVLTRLAGRMGHTDWRARFQGQCVLARRGDQPLVLLKPETFMNRSGESVRSAAAFFKIGPEQTLVVHDELDLPIGSVRLKRGGGEAGHNGLKSITAELGTADYLRLRVGVGRPPAGEVVADFLLRSLSEAEQTELEPCIEEASDAATLVVDHGSERAMNLVNRKPKAPKQSEDGRRE
jgi:peptidyl-tRNA hydrolase, PTH1 family